VCGVDEAEVQADMRLFMLFSAIAAREDPRRTDVLTTSPNVLYLHLMSMATKIHPISASQEPGG
jgi:hypothetical protein